MLLITGATGQLGAAVAAQLIHRKAPHWGIFARDAAKARRYTDQGITARFGDFDQPETLPAAFDGVRQLLLISSRSMDRAAQQKKVVDAAQAAGVQHIIYTGLAIQDIARSHVQNLMQSHFDTEAHIRASGMDYTFVRNTMYADALPEILGPAWRRHGIVLPGGNGQVPYALRRELGEALANLLLQDGHREKTYDFTGTASYTYGEVAKVLSQLAGQPVPYTDAEPSAYGQQLQDMGLPDFLVYLTQGTVLDVRDHQYEVISNALHTLLGRVIE